MEHARPPAELSLEGGPAMRSESWRKWRKLFEVFLKASGVSKEAKDVQASLLVNLIGPAGYEVYTTFTYEKGESEDDIECLMRKFEEHFNTKPNITVRRFKFFSRNQDENESIDEYVTALRMLSQQCEFSDLQESLIRDKIVCGIVNNKVRDRLLRTEELTLSKTIQICQVAELSKEEGLCIDGSSDSAQVNAMSASGSYRERGHFRTGGRWRRGGGAGGRGSRGVRGGGGGAMGLRPRSEAAGRDVCASCGSARCAAGDKCPARYAMCFMCDQMGHYSRVCERKKAMREVLNLSVCESTGSDNEEMFYVNTITEDKKLTIRIYSKDNRKHVKIVAQAAQPRSYIVEDEFGNKFRRTRSHLVVRNTSKIGTRQQTSAPLAQVCPLQKRSVLFSDYNSAAVTFRRIRNKKRYTTNMSCDESIPCIDSDASTLCFGDESSGTSSMANDGYESPLQSPPPPNVPIERSRERTKRMLLNLNKD
ncbi:hypothetical protein ACJJTC_015080 [Scirpophaga incertulas]